MIPDAYDLKRIVRAHRARFWLPDLLEGFEFAPVWRFADQAQFDSDDVDALARPPGGRSATVAAPRDDF